MIITFRFSSSEVIYLSSTYKSIFHPFLVINRDWDNLKYAVNSNNAELEVRWTENNLSMHQWSHLPDLIQTFQIYPVPSCTLHLFKYIIVNSNDTIKQPNNLSIITNCRSLLLNYSTETMHETLSVYQNRTISNGSEVL